MNRYPKVLGFHASIGMEGIVPGWIDNTQTFQFFVASPQRFSDPNQGNVAQLVALASGTHKATVVVHGPYIHNYTRGEGKTMSYGVSFPVMFYGMLKRFTDKVFPLVMHTGKPPEISTDDDEVRSSLMKGMRALQASFDAQGIREACVCLETDASPRSKATQLPGLVQLVKEMGDPRFGVCFDTEHSYASGFDIYSGVLEEYWNWIKVLHLNSIPPEVKFGKGLDRHSKTRLVDASSGNTFVFPTFQNAVLRNIPVILERDDDAVILADMKYLNGEVG